jgi:dihydropteroate synthase
MKLRLRDRLLSFEAGEPLIMGIVNIGDDSVADGRRLATLDAQYEFAKQQHANGAHIIDIGVQSGRTDTPVLPVDVEI